MFGNHQFINIITVLTITVPQSTIEAINYAKEKTKNNTGLKLVFAINYGGRAELDWGTASKKPIVSILTFFSTSSGRNVFKKFTGKFL
jgi:hypothetical protein